METYNLAPDLNICRILNGMWQAGGGHGYTAQEELVVADMIEYHNRGFTSWDMADIYGPAEEFFGKFRRNLSSKYGESELEKIQAFTKYVPQPRKMTRDVVEAAINRSLKRMNTDKLDMVQFHWWDYNNVNWIDALIHLSELRDKGKVRYVGLTNFDTNHMQDIVDAGINIVSNQVLYSVIDHRPEVKMTEFCKRNNISLLTYGTAWGGLLSEKYLGKPEPSLSELNTPSLEKYKLITNAWGGWDLFQNLLSALKGVAEKHNASIANVATRYILDKPAVAGIIIGARLGLVDHREDNTRVFNFKLDEEDYEKIRAATENSRDLFKMIGDCGDEYRN